LNPKWNHHVHWPVYQKSDKLVFYFEVWDKDSMTPDDFLGQCEVTVTKDWVGWGQMITENLQIRPGYKELLGIKGTLSFRLTYCPGDFSKTEVPWKYHNHKFTGLARAISAGEDVRGYATYEIGLHHIQDVFDDKDRKHWNETYDAAIKIFSSNVIKSTIQTQHNHLYSAISVTQSGLIKNGKDLLKLLKNGVKGGKPRFFTYAITNAWYFSETGAAFFVDFTSKHAMHAAAQDHVYYAGEFALIPDKQGTYRLCIDNNSGTYGPKKEMLPKLKLLMELNFPDLLVEANDYHSADLQKYKKYCETGKKEDLE